MNDSLIEQIKEKIDIVEFIGGYLKLQKTGINYKALCPFHSEKTPSFFVSPTRQIWHCFGCNRGSSIFDFLMEIEGVEFSDALKILAQKAGIELKREDPRLKTERQRLLEICEIATKFFEKQLEKSKNGNQIKNYLLKRGLNEESIKKWRLGYAPNNWRALSDFLVGRGYKRKEIIKAGLTLKKEESGFNKIDIYQSYDFFRQRIIFPIFNLNSQVIAFAGRLVPDQEEEKAKYINTPITPLYNKSQTLYGLNFAKLEIKKRDFVILTEGYFDTILLQQAGFENSVAVTGSALTEQHLKILKRYTNNLSTAFDMDLAGDAATYRSINLALKEDFNIKVISLPRNLDPAEIISQNPAQWSKLLENSQEILNFYFDNAFSKFDSQTPEGKKEITKIILPKIKAISNRILQAHWIQELAKKIKINEEAIWEELKKISIEEPLGYPKEIQPKEEVKNRQQLLEEKILSLVLKNPENLKFLDKNSISFFSPNIKTIFTSLKKESDEKNKEKILAKIEEENKEIKEILAKVSLLAEVKNELIPEKGEVDLSQEIEICLRELKKIVLKERLKIISTKIQEAEEKKEEERIKNLTENFNQLIIELQKK